MRDEIYAFGAALFVRPVWMILKTADDKFRFCIRWIEFAELHQNVVKFLVDFRKWFDSRFKAVFEHRGNRSAQFTGARSPLLRPFFINHGVKLQDLGRRAL
jgi:hypothetical protein